MLWRARESVSAPPPPYYPVPPPPRMERRRGISFDHSLSKSYWTWRTNPALMVPTLLSTSISVLAQSIFIVFGTALLVELETNGSFARITSDLAAQNFAALGGVLLSHSVLHLVFEYLGAALVVTGVVSIIASGYTYSAEYLSYIRAIGDNSHVGIGTVFSTLKTKWKPMAWTFLLVQVLTFLPVGLFSALGILLVYGSASNPVALLSFLGLFLFGSLLTGFVAFVMIYATVSVAAENLSGFSAIKRSYHMVRSNFGLSLIYALVTIISYVIISTVADLATNIGVPLTSLASIAITLLIIPVLHLTKTLIYVQAAAPITPSSNSLVNYGVIQGRGFGETFGSVSGLKDLLGGPFYRFALRKLKEGIYGLKNYALNWRNLPYHFASALALVIGIIVGLQIGTHGLDNAILALGYQPGRINPTILGDVPLTAGLDIFLHNWEVSLATALSGMWFIAPSLLTLGFNGLILGVVYYLTPNFTMFAAAIFPHGSIELPSFVISGSAGMRLGVSFIKTLGKGKDSPEEQRFEIVARETIYIVIGLAVLFFIAGLIEGNITPIIMRMYGWK